MVGLPTLTVVPTVSALTRHFQVVATAGSVARCASPAYCEPAAFGASRFHSSMVLQSFGTLRWPETLVEAVL